MSNPTSNFGWQMPTATDLVTDLPADFEVFGQAVDTALADLKGGTTGQVLSKNSATDMDFVWVTDAAGDITGVTAGTGISGGGTSGTVTVTNSMATAFTTSGDLIQATGSGTFARLATGTSGQYLTTNGTTNSWASVSAGSLTLLSTTTLSGASTTISSINQTYTNLVIVMHGITSPVDANTTIRPNGTTSICWATGTRTGSLSIVDQASSNFAPTVSGTLATGGKNAAVITLYNYASTSIFKTLDSVCFMQQTATPLYRGEEYGGGFNLSSAITSLVFDSGGTTYSTGTVLIYGVK